jgi:hypothetical protein
MVLGTGDDTQIQAAINALVAALDWYEGASTSGGQTGGLVPKAENLIIKAWDIIDNYGADLDPGAAALRLMIEKGMLDEESILDGSLFHDCARELVFDSSSPEIERIRESWYQIENQGGVYQFKSGALAP